MNDARTILQPPTAVAPLSTTAKRLAATSLAALLLLLAFRLTSGEFLHESLSQIIAAATAAPGTALTINIGPPHLTFYSAISLFLAAAATASAGLARRFRPRHLLYLAFLIIIAAGSLASTFHADNRFLAIVGTADLLGALAAGYSIALLCDLLGPGKNVIIAALLAMLALGCTKGLLQHFMEFPDLMQYVKEHRDEALRSNGINPNDPLEVKLFLGRINSQEVSGFTHLSNVFATQVIPFLALLTALLIASRPLLMPPADAPFTPAKKTTPEPKQVSLPMLAFIACVILLLAGAIVLPLTDSKGGTIAGILAVFLTLAAGFFWKQTTRHWKTLLAATALITAIGAAAVLFYGIRHDSLPSQSLAFRWQYWTAAVPMIKQHPTLGVGLNNFGDYYLQFKRPSAPEDVKDPHNFFVRLAAELGLPTMALIAALALWLFYLAFRALRASQPAPVLSNETISSKTKNTKNSLATPLILAAVTSSLWTFLHFQFAEEPNAYSLELTILYGILGFSVFAAVLLLLKGLYAPPNAQPAAAPGLPFILFAAAIAAAAMLLYDQVNMALVDGPVAMLFWTLLGLSAATSLPPSTEKTSRPRPTALPLALSILPLAAALATLFLLTLPIAQGTFPWDPTPYEMSYIKKISDGNDSAAQQALNQAIARAPRSLDLLTQNIALDRDRLHLPVADQIRHVLSLDRANAPIRISLASTDSDLPTPERLALLREALTLNDALPKTEIKRLSPEEIAKVEAKIKELAGAH